MTVISSGTWPISATTTSGTELAAYLNEMVDAIQTAQASPTRPPAIQKGGLWTKTLGATDIALMLYDGTTDIEIGKVVGGNATFGGTAVSTTAPTPATAGMLWVDNSVAGAPILKIYSGTAWAAAGGGVVSGTSAPVAPAPVIGDLWVDTTTALKPKLKMYDGAAWQLVYGKDAFHVSVKNVGGVDKGTIHVSEISDAAGTGPVTLTKQSAAKAWFKYNQKVPVVDASFNISSISDVAAGEYKSKFTSAMVDANYTATPASVSVDSVAAPASIAIKGNSSSGPASVYSTTQTEFIVQTGSGSNIDMDHTSAVFHGDLA